MPGLGSLNPCPLILGGTAETGWTAEQFSRVCADVVAASRTIPFAVVRVQQTAGAAELLAYVGQNGVGSAHEPTIAYVSSGTSTVTWPAAMDDELGESHPVNIIDAIATVDGVGDFTATVEILKPNQIKIRTFNANTGSNPDLNFSVEVWGSHRQHLTIADFDGTTDKRNDTEEYSPAAAFYLMLRDSFFGDYRTQSETGLVFCENQATARMLGAGQRMGDMLRNNQLPGLATDMLGEWVTILSVPVKPTDSTESTRRQCAAKYKLLQGPYRLAIAAAAEELLGDLYVKTWTIEGDSLDDPPDNTFWAGGTAGPASYSLGGGAWVSERAHVVFEVNAPEGYTYADYLDRVNSQLFQLMNRALPIYVTFDWAVGVEDGLRLDLDRMDFTGMGTE